MDAVIIRSIKFSFQPKSWYLNDCFERVDVGYETKTPVPKNKP